MFLVDKRRTAILAGVTAACERSPQETRPILELSTACVASEPTSSDRQQQFAWTTDKAQPITVQNACWLIASVNHLAQSEAVLLVAQHLLRLRHTRSRPAWMTDNEFSLAFLFAGLLLGDKSPDTLIGVLAHVQEAKHQVDHEGELCMNDIQVLLLGACAHLDPQYPVLHRLVSTHEYAFPQTTFEDKSLAYALERFGVPREPPPMVTVVLDGATVPSFKETVPLHTQAGVFTYRVTHWIQGGRGHFATVLADGPTDLDPRPSPKKPITRGIDGYSNYQMATDGRWAALGLVLQP